MYVHTYTDESVLASVVAIVFSEALASLPSRRTEHLSNVSVTPTQRNVNITDPTETRSDPVLFLP